MTTTEDPASHTTPAPPAWIHVGAPVAIHTGWRAGPHAYEDATVDRLTRTQVLVRAPSAPLGPLRFHLGDLTEVGSRRAGRRLVPHDDPARDAHLTEWAARLARQDAVKAAWARADKWARTGDPADLDAALRTLTGGTWTPTGYTNLDQLDDPAPPTIHWIATRHPFDPDALVTPEPTRTTCPTCLAELVRRFTHYLDRDDAHATPDRRTFHGGGG